ncbi:MAG TPA: tetratricopeptide repeat protein [Candidatus Polarisedimenticolaceae bacterium]|nr:tetratricopeptide repeat protein [Candidatus Polarisedimenticolaceae bacterium]
MIAAAIPPARAGETNPKPKGPGPTDFFKIEEKSDVEYDAKLTSALKNMGPEEFADAFWPEHSKGLVHPYIRRAGGAVSLIELPVPPAEAAALEAADSAYEKKDYQAAREDYFEVLRKFPDSYLAHLHLGDTYSGLGEREKALSEYRQAIKLNPDDHAGYTSVGRELARLGKKDDAIAAWTRALALRPHDESTLALAAEFGIARHAPAFRPKAYVRKENDVIVSYVPGDAPGEEYAHWYRWAACKAVWLGEPEYAAAHRSTKKGWTGEEDIECMLNLLVAYKVHLEHGNGKGTDPELDRLLPLLDDLLLREFVVYEIGARYSPDIVLMLRNPKLDMDAYVRKYVLH